MLNILDKTILINTDKYIEFKKSTSDKYFKNYINSKINNLNNLKNTSKLGLNTYLNNLKKFNHFNSNNSIDLIIKFPENINVNSKYTKNFSKDFITKLCIDLMALNFNNSLNNSINQINQKEFDNLYNKYQLGLPIQSINFYNFNSLFDINDIKVIIDSIYRNTNLILNNPEINIELDYKVFNKIPNAISILKDFGCTRFSISNFNFYNSSSSISFNFLENIKNDNYLNKNINFDLILDFEEFLLDKYLYSKRTIEFVTDLVNSYDYSHFSLYIENYSEYFENEEDSQIDNENNNSYDINKNNYISYNLDNLNKELNDLKNNINKILTSKGYYKYDKYHYIKEDTFPSVHLNNLKNSKNYLGLGFNVFSTLEKFLGIYVIKYKEKSSKDNLNLNNPTNMFENLVNNLLLNSEFSFRKLTDQYCVFTELENLILSNTPFTLTAIENNLKATNSAFNFKEFSVILNYLIKNNLLDFYKISKDSITKVDNYKEFGKDLSDINISKLKNKDYLVVCNLISSDDFDAHINILPFQTIEY